MSYKLPFRASRALVSIVSGGCALGAGILLYQRHVVGNPMTIIRDGEGVLRFQTRRDFLEQRVAVAQARLLLSPEDKRLQFDFAISRRELDACLAKEGATGAAPPLTDSDLK